MHEKLFADWEQRALKQRFIATTASPVVRGAPWKPKSVPLQRGEAISVREFSVILQEGESSYFTYLHSDDALHHVAYTAPKLICDISSSLIT